ncbi:MAG: hypothetical protein WCL19_11565, partial [Verrucomicrobiota bacterium]
TGIGFGALIHAVGRKARLGRVRAIEEILRSRGVTVFRSVAAPKSARRLTCASAGVDSVASLREYRLGDAALGLGTLSTLVRLTGDSNPDFSANRALIDRILNSAHRAFLLTTELVERFKPDEILLYNGRLAVSKGISEAARLSDVGVLYHELVSTHDRFFLAPYSPHSQRNTRRELSDSWASAGAGRETIAERYFTPGRGGVPLFETPYLELQRRDQQLPASGRWRLAYFVSSIDEYAAVEDGFENPLFDSQQSAAEWLVSWVRGRPDTELVIRMHPRSRGLSARERNWWESLAAANVTVLAAESSVDSYGLALSADRVVSHHSSIGAEAAYLGKVSILVGDADYRGLDCVYEPRTIDELARMLCDRVLQPKSRENCLPFGYQRLMRGERYRFYQPTTFHGGGFFGQRITPDKEEPPLARVTMRTLWRLKGFGARVAGVAGGVPGKRRQTGR